MPLSLKQVVGPAIELADRGFVVGAQLATALRDTTHPSVLAFFQRDGAPCAVSTFKINLWREHCGMGTVRASVQHGADAQRMVAAIQRDGAVVSMDDLKRYRPKERQPIVTSYKSYSLVTMPPPSSGGIVLSQVLQVLESTDFSKQSHNSSAYIHLLAETMKHAYADRAHHLGDPDVMPTDRLLSPVVRNPRQIRPKPDV